MVLPDSGGGGCSLISPLASTPMVWAYVVRITLFFLQRKYGAPFFLQAVNVRNGYRKKSNKSVVVRDNEMAFGTVRPM